MKTLRLLLLAPLLMACPGEDEINIEEDLLFETGIYGGWKLESQTTDGIADNLEMDEIFLEFYPDKNIQDNIGEYELEEPNKNTVGNFVLNESDLAIILLTEGQTDINYDYLINSANTYLTLSFTKNDMNIKQDWRKVY